MSRSLLVIASVLFGCSASGTMPCGDGVCDVDESFESCLGDCPPPEPMSRTYVISTMDVGAHTTDDTAYGFDLDGTNGGDRELPCTRALDFTSRVTGATGVDNQINTIRPTVGDPTLDERNEPLRYEIQRGAMLVVMEITGIDGFDDDPSVSVHVVLGEVPGGGAPVIDEMGLAPDQTFSTRAEIATVVAAIVDHRLTVRTEATFPFSTSATMDMARVPFSMPLHDVVLGGRIDASGFDEGELGGAIRLTDILAMAVVVVPGADLASIEALVQPDIGPDATGEHCDSASAGFAFTTVAATLE